jgi:hypothetical protein
MTVTFSTIGGDEQLRGSWEAALPHLLPPPANAVGCKLRRVMVDADIHPTLVVQNVIDAIGDRFAESLVHDVVDADFRGVTLLSPLAPPTLETPTNSFIFMSTEIAGRPRR